MNVQAGSLHETPTPVSPFSSFLFLFPSAAAGSGDFAGGKLVRDRRRAGS